MRIRDDVLRFPAYRGNESTARINLDKNESPWDLPHELKEEIAREIKKIEFNRYPHIHSRPLRENIAETYGLSFKNVAVGNGCDELLGYLVKLFTGNYVIIAPPTFSMYALYARFHGIPMREIPLRRDFTIDGEKMAKEANNAAAVFIASPNNPTGNTQPEDEIAKILDTGAPVILDEAYWEFAGKSLINLLHEYPNLIIVRTFSKAFGLAAIRAGYMLASEEIVDALHRIKVPYGMNALSMMVASKLLEHKELVMRRVRYIIAERERIYRKMGRYAYPSQANFLLIKLDAYDFLMRRGIAVKRLEGRLRGHIRVTVGRREENNMLLLALKEFQEARNCG